MSYSKDVFFKLLLLSIFSLSSLQVHATIYSLNDEGEDKIIKMYGYIYDTISENPNKLPVQAKMVLESQPYASEIGIITSNDSSGYYEYYINMSKNYIIIVKSEHHSSYTDHLDPTKVIANEEIIRNYYLQPEIRENQVIRLKKLIFEQGKANITPESFQELNRLAVLMNENPSMQIQLEGHTDYRGSKKLNMELSQQRVEAVKAYLTGKSINTRRIKTKAFGGKQPLIREQSIEASEINRRVEVRILKLDN